MRIFVFASFDCLFNKNKLSQTFSAQPKIKLRRNIFLLLFHIFILYIFKKKLKTIWQEEGGKVKDNQVNRVDKK